MEFVVNSQTIIVSAAVVTALMTLGGLFVRLHRWVIKQEEQDKEIEELKAHHDDDIDQIKKTELSEFKEIKEDLQLLTVAVLACLKSLKEKGENGAVTEAIDKLEAHLINRAHN